MNYQNYLMKAKVGGFFLCNLCVVNLLYDELDTHPIEPKKSEFYLIIKPDVIYYYKKLS